MGVQIFPFPFLMKIEMDGLLIFLFVNYPLKNVQIATERKQKNGNNIHRLLKMMQREESESSRAKKLRKTLQATILGLMIMVKPKQYQKNLCFLGCLLSPPLYSYIFHQVSTKRGRSIFYHKSL